MSTIVNSGHNQILKSEKDLARYFHAYAKPASDLKVGIEAEFLGVYRSSGKALPYSGASGIREILSALASKFSYSPILDLDNIIGLKREDSMIALEPGGQIELSAPPVSNIFEIESQIKRFLCELKAIEKEFPDARFLAYGIQPFSTLDEISWVPKRRYGLMAAHMASRGSLSHHMMKRTATNQLNLDYTDEEDAMKKLRAAFAITSIVTALFSNSSFSEGRPNGYATYRLEIWNHTDPDRSGLLNLFTESGKKFQDYLEYALNIPVFFIVREGEWLSAGGISFREFIRDGFSGQQPTLNDFELHLSTIFPEVRIKQYLEVRGVDCQSPALIPAMAAFWKGILYSPTARDKALELVSFASPEERLKLHLEVPRQGLQARLAGRPIAPLAEQLVNIACAGLSEQQTSSRPNECLFLDKLRELVVKPGKSPGETLVQKWQAEFNRQPGLLLEYLGI